MNKISVENEIQEMLDALTQEFPVAKEEDIREQLSSEIETEQRSIRRRLRRDNPFKEHQIVLRRTENELKENMATIDQLEQDFQHFQAFAKQTNSRIDEAYWLSEIEKLKENRKADRQVVDLVIKELFEEPTMLEEVLQQYIHEDQIIFRRLLLQQWRRLLDEQVTQWEIETIQKLRRELLGRLKEWLEKLQLLADTLDELSIEPGILFDLSKGNLSLSNIEELKRWVSYISEDKGVRELCDMMGRLRRAEKAKRQELIKNLLTVTEYVPDINSREEIVGVYLGKDVEHALPQEIALLSDEDTSLLFDMKFVEGSLDVF